MSLIRIAGNIAEATAVSMTQRHLDAQARKQSRRRKKAQESQCTPCEALKRLGQTRQKLGFNGK